MAKIIVTVGISGSGKSTYAHTLWATNPSQYVIVNRDKIRELLFGYTETTITSDYWVGRKDLTSREKEVTKYQDVMINEALTSGKIPIVDATHLTKKYIQAFRIWNVPVELVFFNVKPEVAFERIEDRTRQLEFDVIKKQQNQLDTLMNQMRGQPSEFDFKPTSIVNNSKLPGCVIVDIDGTLAHMELRSPYDWHRVGEDRVDEATASLVINLHKAGTKIIICTGRDGVCIPETQKWLKDNIIPYDGIFIRDKGDQRPDWVVKEEMWSKITQVFYIEYMVDDRQQVVRRARALGFKVMNVEYNNF